MLTASCVHCPAPVAEATDGTWSCPDHGVTRPLWRAKEASYDGFAEHLRTADGFPTYVPWPLSPGWSLTDFAAVAPVPGRATASMTCTSGTSELDGPVDVLVVAEEAGTGLGARCAGTRYTDPGFEIGERPPSARVRIGSQAVNLWDISTSSDDGEFDRCTSGSCGTANYVKVRHADGKEATVTLKEGAIYPLFSEMGTLR